MQLTVWTYEGPPHVGALRIATAMQGVHYVLHAPQGDTYADLLFTMIERRPTRPPVSYTTFAARDLGGNTAEAFKRTARDAVARYAPQALLVGASCTGELIQDDPGGLARALGLSIPVIPLELSAYQRKENWGAAETFYQLVRTLVEPVLPSPATPRPPRAPGVAPSCNILGPAALGFRHRDDLVEVRRLLDALGIRVNVVAPEGATPADLARLPDADFNVVLYPEIASTAAAWLTRRAGQPATTTIPIGIGATREFVEEVARLAGVDPAPVLARLAGLPPRRRAGAAPLAPAHARLPWYSRSVDSTYLTGKRVFIFGDATHAIAAARMASEEFGFTVVGLGTYAREFARDVRAAAARYGLEALITDDYLEVEAKIAELHPELVLGTQMERHTAKRLGVPCAVISAPMHVQDFPARYAPQMGIEGANVIFDTWVHPLMMGLEEHLLTLFREDFEFHEAPSHLGAAARAPGAEAERAAESFAPSAATTASAPPDAAPSLPPSAAAAVSLTPPVAPAPASSDTLSWSSEAELELKKIPFFVRGKARRNTERYAREHGLALITVEDLYDAKAHFSR
ncbi:ferredoxin:protochlorophyllide reductase (ATP-dependent) subunit B [Rhodocyclus tenuis]|uniref:ferredoxin:protochlorophyllide reductase (ATP-dependent) subunit B n=1 Tax=Rhodocyclus gracilis TaxID=2929842 RepID=UPI001298A987|nr:ferredoxin:protochlorophyllide reductase (ATP-dependent) subunit B [Rhodocyclus gracilis]MRD74181.1 ferredoxin:protochlorophyllide reductase (ATP-dependent) subunit B [Rhodocyclus gracilis]